MRFQGAIALVHFCSVSVFFLYIYVHGKWPQGSKKGRDSARCPCSEALSIVMKSPTFLSRACDVHTFLLDN